MPEKLETLESKNSTKGGTAKDAGRYAASPDGIGKKAAPAWNARRLAFLGMLGALSMVLMLIRFPLWFAPSFLDFDVADLPALFAGFFLGPLDGVIVIFVKILLKIVFQGSNTAFVGEFSNVTMSCVFVLCASLIYKRNKTKKTAVLSMVIASVLVSIVGIFLNAYVMFPLYSNLYHMPMEAIVAAGSAVNPLVKDEVTLMLFAVFPFNLVKHAITSLVTFLIYKRSGRVLRGLLQGAK